MKPEEQCNIDVNDGPDGGAGGNLFTTETYVTGVDFEKHDQWATKLDTSCLKSALHGDEACRDPMHVLMFHVETPVFISATKYDASLRSGEPNNSYTGKHDAWENEDFSTRVQMVADSLRRPAGLSHKDMVKLPGHGMFLTHCGGENSHKGQSFQGKWDSRILDNTSGDTKSQFDYFDAWLNSTTAYQPYCASASPVDTCKFGMGMDNAKVTEPSACFLP